MATEAQPQLEDAGPSTPAAGSASVAAPVLEQPHAPEQSVKVEGSAKGKPSKKDPKSSKKDSKSSKSKSAKSGESTEQAVAGPSVAAHPRAAHQVARAKSWGGLIGFVIGGYFSMATNTFIETGLRALVAGVVCYLAVWAAAVFVWRQLVVLEIKSREQELLSAARNDAPAAVAARAGADR